MGSVIVRVHNAFQPFLSLQVLDFVDHDAHGIAKQRVHFGFQPNASHVFHPLGVLVGPRLHFRIGDIGIRGVVGNEVQPFHASGHRRNVQHGDVRLNFHELVGFRHDSNETAVINDVDARQARDSGLCFFADKREKLQRVLVRAPNAEIIHHHQVHVNVRHARVQRRCRRHDDAVGAHFCNLQANHLGIVIQHQPVDSKLLFL